MPQAYKHIFLILVTTIIGAITVGCNANEVQLPDAQDMHIATPDILNTLKQVRNSIGSNEQKYAPEYILAADEAYQIALQAAAESNEDNERIALVNAIRLYAIATDITDTITNPRRLRFPDNKILGEISVLSWGSNRGYRRLGEASGTVSVERELNVQFSATADFEDEDMDALAELQPGAIQYLNLSETKITDAGLQRLQDITGVVSISLHKTAVTDESLKLIGTKARQLRHINLLDTAVTTKGISYLANMPALEEIVIGNTKITESSLLILKDLPRLKTLLFRDTPLSDVGLEHIKDMHQLERLWLSGNQITDYGIPFLFNLENLQELIFFQTSVTQQGVNMISSNISNCRIQLL